MKSAVQKTSSMLLIAMVLLQLCLFIYGCSNAIHNPKATKATEAYSLYASKCSSCHRLLPPQDHTKEQWQQYVDKYGEKIAPLQRQKILNYLTERAVDSRNSQH